MKQIKLQKLRLKHFRLLPFHGLRKTHARVKMERTQTCMAGTLTQTFYVAK